MYFRKVYRSAMPPLEVSALLAKNTSAPKWFRRNDSLYVGTVKDPSFRITRAPNAWFNILSSKIYGRIKAAGSGSEVRVFFLPGYFMMAYYLSLPLSLLAKSRAQESGPFFVNLSTAIIISIAIHMNISKDKKSMLADLGFKE